MRFIDNSFNNKTVIMLSHDEHRLILANSVHGFVG